MVGQHVARISRQVSQSFFFLQKLGSIDKLHQSNNTLQTILFVRNKIEVFKFGLFQGTCFAGDLHDSKSRQAACYANSKRKHVFQFRVCARIKPQFLAAVPYLKIISSDAGFENARHTSITIEGLCLILFIVLIMCHLISLTTSRPTFQRVHSQRWFSFDSVTSREKETVIRMITKGQGYTHAPC